VGKSATINALLENSVATIGDGYDPETTEIKSFEKEGLRIWDTPGLAEGMDADDPMTQTLISKLQEQDEHGQWVIDLVVVIVDGSRRDLGSTYQLMREILVPALQQAGSTQERLLVAVNQADMAMKGRGWNVEENQPEPDLVAFLEQQMVSIQQRIHEASAVECSPIYYSAGYEDDEESQAPWNIVQLKTVIQQHAPVFTPALTLVEIPSEETAPTESEAPTSEAPPKPEPLSVFEVFKRRVSSQIERVTQWFRGLQR
jgi:predicted GTPase